jgi:RNA polymerase sigma factor (sigma-70 family)
MKRNIEYKNVAPNRKEHIQTLCERYLASLQKHLQVFPSDTVFLYGVIEQHPSRALYRVSLTLHLPKRLLSAKEEGHEINDTIREAFLELERQLEKHKALLRQEHLWRRPARREQLRQERTQAPSAPAAREQELSWAVIQAHLKKLYNFVRRELAYRQAIGDLLPGELTPQDVVDAVVLQGAREFASRPPHQAIDRWLLQLARAYIAVECKRLKAERAHTRHIEAATPPDPAKEVPTLKLDDEIYEFYQPDEKLRLEDLVPDPYVPTPEQVIESRDLQRYINQTLALLPQAWRTAFVLHYIEDLTIPEVAHLTGTSEDEVRHALIYAREFLRQKLLEADLAELPEDSDATWRFFSTAADVDVPEALQKRVTARMRQDTASAG